MLEEHKKQEEFIYNCGIIEYVKMLNRNNSVLHPDVIYVEGKQNDILVEVACQYNTSYQSQIYSFTNNIHTTEGGTHEDGAKQALTRVLNNYAKKAKIIKDSGIPAVEIFKNKL